MTVEWWLSSYIIEVFCRCKKVFKLFSFMLVLHVLTARFSNAVIHVVQSNLKSSPETNPLNPFIFGEGFVVIPYLVLHARTENRATKQKY